MGRKKNQFTEEELNGKERKERKEKERKERKGRGGLVALPLFFGVRQTVKQSSSRRRQLHVGAKMGGFTEAPRGRFPPTPVHFKPKGHVGA